MLIWKSKHFNHLISSFSLKFKKNSKKFRLTKIVIFFHALLHSHPLVNPLIYATRIPNVRTKFTIWFKMAVCCFCCRKKNRKNDTNFKSAVVPANI